VQGARSEGIKPYLADRSVPVYAGASYPIPQLIESSAALGNVTADSDSDKIFRRTVPGAYLNDVPVLSLPFALYDVTHPDSSLIPQLDRIADSGGRLHIRFHGPSATYDTFSIAAVINSWLKLEEGNNPDIPLSEFKDAYVFVGTNAPGLFDLRPAPLAGNYPGVELNATILDNILHSSFLRTVPTHLALGIAAVFLGFVAVLATKVERFQIPMIVAVLSVWVGISIFVAHKGWWLPLVAPTVGSLYVLLLVFLLKYRIEGREHRFIRNAFQHYVTPEVIDQIVRDPSHLSLGGERRELTILFSDIRGFTSISEKMKPSQLVGFLNKFLSEMTDIILAAGGTIDKYEGDAIIAFWNAPVKVVDHEKRGVQAALACQRRLRELRSTFTKEYGVDVGMRVGLHSGLVTVGNFGSTTRFNYTVIGDAANLASRLEGTNKVFGTETLVSADTRKKAGEDYIWRQVAKIRVVGRHEPVVVFEPLQPGMHDQTIALLGEYERARGLFEEGALDEAKSRFAILKDDPVSNAYRERIELFQKGELEFSSVWSLTEK
jgi:adenylate cyclase